MTRRDEPAAFQPIVCRRRPYWARSRPPGRDFRQIRGFSRRGGYVAPVDPPDLTTTCVDPINGRIKYRHPDVWSALATLTKIQVERAVKGLPPREQTIYPHAACGGWHLSSRTIWHPAKAAS